MTLSKVPNSKEKKVDSHRNSILDGQAVCGESRAKPPLQHPAASSGLRVIPSGSIEHATHVVAWSWRGLLCRGPASAATITVRDGQLMDPRSATSSRTPAASFRSVGSALASEVLEIRILKSAPVGRRTGRRPIGARATTRHELSGPEKDTPIKLSPRSIGSDVRRSRDRLGQGRLVARRPRRVVNATGVVLHTNLGRAPLGRASCGSSGGGSGSGLQSSLELDLETGRRGQPARNAQREAEAPSLGRRGRSRLATTTPRR